jgi:hypothetical protein
MVYFKQDSIKNCYMVYFKQDSVKNKDIRKMYHFTDHILSSSLCIVFH